MLGFLPSVVISSAIADSGNWNNKNHKGQVEGHNSTRLYYFLRACDYQGCGSVDVDLRLAALALDKSLYTIRRWLKAGLQLGIFRGSGRVGTKTYRIFYTSLEKIARRFDTGLGACTEVEVSDLNHAKFIATEVTAKQLQNQSRYRASDNKRKNLKKCIPTAEVLTTSDLCSGAILHKVGRFTYLKFYAHPHGASQDLIAYEQGRHCSTIQRRLSDGYRRQHGLEPIPKTQILAAPLREASQVNGRSIQKLRTFISVQRGDFIGRPDRNRKIKPIKIWKTSLGYFRLCPNVYDIPRELTSKRRLRSKLKRQETYEEWMASEEARSLKKSWQAINRFYLSSEKIAPADT